MLFWARYGNEGLAQELAAYFVSHRNGTEHWCGFRGVRHTSLVVQSSDLEDVSEMMQEITEEELAAELTTAFELLRIRMSPDGTTIDDPIKQAETILQSLE